MGKKKPAADPPQSFEVVANLADRQSSLMMSGRGDRVLVELELFQVNAAIGLVGFAAYAGTEFVVSIRPLTDEEREKAKKDEPGPTF